MLRILVLSGLLALAAAAPADARCRAVLKDGDSRLGRTARGWELCGRGIFVQKAGRPVALRDHGDDVVVRLRERGRTHLHFIEADEEPLRYGLVLPRGERVARYVYLPSEYGMGELYVAVDGQRPRIHVVGDPGEGALDRTRGLVAGSLRLRDGVVRWRIGDRWRRIDVNRRRDLPPEDCDAPAWARSVHRHGEALAFELRFGNEGAVFGCYGGGPVHQVAETSVELVMDTTQVLLLVGPFGVFKHRFSWKETSEGLFAVDLRTGTRTAAAGLAGGLLEVFASPTGAIAFSQRVAGGPEIVTARGETVETLDSGPDVDGISLKLEGTTLSWVSGAGRRTAQLP